MTHDPSKVLLGSTNSNIREVDNKKGVIEAGLIARLKSDDTLSIAKADGSAIGLSLGKDLSGIDRSAVCRKGLGVPLQVTASFTPTKGTQVHISDTTGKAIASGAGATGTNAVYASGVLTGVKEDGTTTDVVLIDFPGGL